MEPLYIVYHVTSRMIFGLCKRECKYKSADKLLCPNVFFCHHPLINYLALTIVSMPPWCNETAYPVEIVTWKGTEYSRLDAATDLFHKVI